MYITLYFNFPLFNCTKGQLIHEIIETAYYMLSRSQFIWISEDDGHGRQLVAYKMLKGMNKNENYKANLNFITERKCIDHYKALWSNNHVKTEHNNIETNNSVIYEGE